MQFRQAILPPWHTPQDASAGKKGPRHYERRDNVAPAILPPRQERYNDHNHYNEEHKKNIKTGTEHI